MLFLLLFFFLGLLSTAYLTLHERHVLGLSHRRLGPNKPGFYSLFLPFFDAFKLLHKEVLLPFRLSFFYYCLSPVFIFGFWCFFWTVCPYKYPFLSIPNGGLFFSCLVGSIVYSSFFSGYISGSKYAHLGAMRCTAQSITFEVSFFFLVLAYLYVRGDYELGFGGSLLHLPMAYLWFLFLLVELGRAPVDFPEGESETVSGYNLEYGGLFFIFIFLSEYGFLLFWSGLFSQLFLNWTGFPFFTPYLVFTFCLLLRSSFPRYRYDLLIGFFWRVLLPVSMHMLLFYYVVSKIL